MKRKKSKKSDLERKRFHFFLIGILLVGSMCLMAFEYTTPNVEEAKYEFVDYQETISLDEDPIYELVVPKTQKKVVITEFEDIKIVKKLTKEGDVKFSDQIIIDECIDCDECLDCDIDMTIIPEDNDSIFKFSDIEPEFPGGDGEMNNFISTNVVYPSISVDMGEEGIVYVKFVVGKDGSISNTHVIQGDSESLNKEAIRIVNSMPKWTPGEHAGKKVNVEFTLPIFFKLK